MKVNETWAGLRLVIADLLVIAVIAAVVGAAGAAGALLILKAT